MAIPADVTSIVVTGTYVDASGTPSTGTVSFTPTGWTASTGEDTVIAPSSVVATLGTAGDIAGTLVVNDDPDLTPGPWYYTVEERINGHVRTYSIELLASMGGTVDMADLVPVAPVGEQYYSLVSSLTIGTVTTVATGGSATATITGTAPNQTLNLGIPTGATGSVSTLGTGTASAPAIYPSGDTDTGLFFPAADTLAVSTGGTERLRIDTAGLITGTGTSLGAWTAYTPTWSSTGTAPAIGNGTITGHYVRIGKVVHFRVVLTLGSTSTVGTGAWTFTLPLTGTAVNQGFLGTAFIWDASASAAYTAILERSSSTVFFLRSTGAATGRVSGVAPFTWTPADADYAQITGTYEIA